MAGKRSQENLEKLVKLLIFWNIQSRIWILRGEKMKIKNILSDKIMLPLLYKNS